MYHHQNCTIAERIGTKFHRAINRWLEWIVNIMKLTPCRALWPEWISNKYKHHPTLPLELRQNVQSTSPAAPCFSQHPFPLSPSITSSPSVISNTASAHHMGVESPPMTVDQRMTGVLVQIRNTVPLPPEIRGSTRLNNCVQLEGYILNSKSLINEKTLLPVIFCIHLCNSTAQVYLPLILFPTSTRSTSRYPQTSAPRPFGILIQQPPG